MKIVVVAAMFPPAGHGGAEDCARSFALWAATNGHEVAVVMAAKGVNEAPVFSDGPVTVHRLETGHVYPVARAAGEPKWKKPVWHLQDHLDGRTAARVARLVAEERPDVVMVHYVQGFGYRTISALAGLGVPIAMVLHDLGLVCWRMSMFRHGAECGAPCIDCRLSTALKRRIFLSAAESAPIGFISPSCANLERIGRYFPVDQFPHAVILNTKTYPVVPRAADNTAMLRLLYAGKLEPSKGVDRLAAAVSALPAEAGISLTIAGSGSLGDTLRERYGANKRVSLLGFLSQEGLAREMARSHLLCVPSIWPENSPGVAIQAILNGLPLMVTAHGGLPELVRDGIDGRMIVGDDVAAWSNSLLDLSRTPGVVANWQSALAEKRAWFDVDVIGRETIAFLSDLAGA